MEPANRMYKFEWNNTTYYFDTQSLRISTRSAKEATPLGHPSLDLKLSQIILQIAGDCNLGCPYCYTDKGRYGEQSKWMSENVAKRAIDFLLDRYSSEVIVVNFFGGEPLLRWELIKDVISYAGKKIKNRVKMFFNISTNGTLLDKEKVDFLRQHPNVLGLLSLDSNIEAIEDMLRPYKNGRGSYKVLIEKIKKYKLQEIFAIRATLTKKNMQIFDLFKFVAGLGFKDFHIVPVLSADAEYALSLEDIKNLEPEIDKIARFDIMFGEESGQITPFAFSKFISVLDANEPRVMCSGGRTTLTVSADGGIYSCHHLINNQKFKMGDLENGLDAIKHKNFLTEIHSDNKEKCKDCWAKNICGGCYEEAFLFNGSTQKPTENFCAWHRMMFKYALVLYEKIQEQRKTKNRFINSSDL